MRRSVAFGLALAALGVLASAPPGVLAFTPARPMSSSPGLIRLGGTPLQLVGARDSLWLSTCDRRCSGEARRSVGRIVHINARTGRVVDSVAIDRPDALAVGPSSVYATDFWNNAVRRLDARTLRLAGRLGLTLPFYITTTTYRSTAFAPEAVAVGSTAVWIATDRGALAQADLRLRRVIKTLRLPFDAFEGMAVGHDAVWLSEGLLGLYRVDLTTDRVVVRIPIGPRVRRLVAVQLYPVGSRLLAVGEWTSGGVLTDRNGLALISATHNRVQATTALPAGPLTSAYGRGSLWVARVGGSSLERVDARTGRVVAQIHARVGEMLAVAGGYLWTAFRDGTVRRLAVP